VKWVDERAVQSAGEWVVCWAALSVGAKADLWAASWAFCWVGLSGIRLAVLWDAMWVRVRVVWWVELSATLRAAMRAVERVN
jgi:hypothetical protein